MRPKDADGMANHENPDQIALLGVVWSGFTLFVQICISENVGSLQYRNDPKF